MNEDPQCNAAELLARLLDACAAAIAHSTHSLSEGHVGDAREHLTYLGDFSRAIRTAAQKGGVLP